MILALYRGLTTLAAPLILLLLWRRRRRGKEHPERLGERLGRAGLPRPSGRLVWLHAASVGEALSLLPLMARLQAEPGRTLLLTTGTVTSAALLRDKLPPGALHQFVPVDRLPWVRRFLDHWRPDLAVWAESEFWPNLLGECRARALPVVLVNGRVSDRSLARWRRLPGLIGPLLGSFVLALGQTERDAARLALLGARNTACLGNLKFAAPPLAADPLALAQFTVQVGARPRWLAVSTHDGEEALVGRVHRRVAATHPGLLSLIVPRHPERGDALAAALAGDGLRLARRSRAEPIAVDTDIYLADSIGELGLWIRLAPIVLIGKSLIGRGGQNPLEPARLGAAVLFGPHMGNFVDIAAAMQQAGAAQQVADEADLALALAALLADPEAARRQGREALRFAASQDGVLAAVCEAVRPWLPSPTATGEEHHAGA